VNDRCEQIDNGRQTEPTRGKVYVEPRPCRRSDQHVTVRLPSVPHDVPLGARDKILLASGLPHQAAPTLDTSDCSVRLTVTPGQGRLAAADVDGGVVGVRQDRTSRRAVTTELTLRRPLCAESARTLRGGHSRVHVGTTLRPGHWRVRGNYSTATAEGTDWTTDETCRSTTTTVLHGRVRVYDRIKRRWFTARPGRPHVARAR
jgi:hypothetical protein